MRNTLVAVLLLSTVALSSSNILPILNMREVKSEPTYGGQSNENIFSSKHRTRNDMDDFLFKTDIDKQRPSADTRDLYQKSYFTNNDAGEEIYDTVSKDDNYDVKGFRKEQWHNYPRQLDRLSQYIFEHYNSDKRNLDPDDPGEYGDKEEVFEKNPKDKASNEFLFEDYGSQEPIYEADKTAAIMNPLIVLKIHLACLRKDADNNNVPFTRASDLEYKLRRNENEDYSFNDENPKTNVVKVKREGTSLDTANTEQNMPKNRMNKRIFSLWSRLQSLNHKGHELHHRRHLYALYGLPDSEGGGVLTAETRATFMRPPGSPLRWG